MTYDIFQVIDVNEFNATGLVSREVTLFLEGKGEKTFLVTKGNILSVIVDGVFLSPGLNGRNPFKFDSRAAWVDSNDKLWVGFPSAD